MACSSGDRICLPHSSPRAVSDSQRIESFQVTSENLVSVEPGGVGDHHLHDVQISEGNNKFHYTYQEIDSVVPDSSMQSFQVSFLLPYRPSQKRKSRIETFTKITFGSSFAVVHAYHLYQQPAHRYSSKEQRCAAKQRCALASERCVSDSNMVAF